MPGVRIQYNPTVISGSTIIVLNMGIGEIVATNLSCGNFMLTSNDISLTFQPYGPYDRHQNDLEVHIDAFSCPSRLADINDRNDRMRDQIMQILPQGTTFFVWTRLTEGAFSKA